MHLNDRAASRYCQITVLRLCFNTHLLLILHYERILRSKLLQQFDVMRNVPPPPLPLPVDPEIPPRKSSPEDLEESQPPPPSATSSSPVPAPQAASAPSSSKPAPAAAVFIFLDNRAEKFGHSDLLICYVNDHWLALFLALVTVLIA